MLGDGVFRTILVENKVPIHLQLHLDKLSFECTLAKICCELPSPLQIKDYVEKHSDLGIYRLRITVIAKERHLLTSWVEGECLLSINPYTQLKENEKLIVYPYPFHRLNPKIKSTSFLDQLTLFTWAKERGYDEVLTVNHEGFVLEGAFCNVFWEEEEALFFMDRSLPYYEGLTQEMMIQNTTKEVHFVRATPNQLIGKTLYTCNSLKGICPAEIAIS